MAGHIVSSLKNKRAVNTSVSFASFLVLGLGPCPLDAASHVQ